MGMGMGMGMGIGMGMAHVHVRMCVHTAVQAEARRRTACVRAAPPKLLVLFRLRHEPQGAPHLTRTA